MDGPSQSSLIFFYLFVGWLIFVTRKGTLNVYISALTKAAP